MKFWWREGITDWARLVDLVREQSSVKAPLQDVKYLVSAHLEMGIEVYRDEELVGYVLIFKTPAGRSLHGYKLIHGFIRTELNIIREILQKYEVDFISTTVDKKSVGRLAHVLGFTQDETFDGRIVFRRAYETLSV